MDVLNVQKEKGNTKTNWWAVGRAEGH